MYKFVFVFLLAALQTQSAFAQITDPEEARALTHQKCRDGDQASCIAIRVIEGPEIERAVLESEDGAPVAPLVQTPADAVPVVTQPIEAKSTPWWMILLMFVGGFVLLRFIIRVLVGSVKNVASDLAWEAEPMPVPEYALVEREQHGNPVEPTGADLMIADWDRSEIFDWLDQRISNLETQVETPLIIEAVHKMRQNPGTFPVRKQELREYMEERYDALDDDDVAIWNDVDVQYYNLNRARYRVLGGGYFIANMLEYSKVEAITPKRALQLWRLDADLDFNPACVNMADIALKQNMSSGLGTSVTELETYLRYFFGLGAPDGHFHIATQLLDFYFIAPEGVRDDAGYVAAALDRVKQYDPAEAKDWLADLTRTKKHTYDLNDTSVSRAGIMYEMAQKEQGPLQ